MALDLNKFAKVTAAYTHSSAGEVASERYAFSTIDNETVIEAPGYFDSLRTIVGVGDEITAVVTEGLGGRRLKQYLVLAVTDSAVTVTSAFSIDGSDVANSINNTGRPYLSVINTMVYGVGASTVPVVYDAIFQIHKVIAVNSFVNGTNPGLIELTKNGLVDVATNVTIPTAQYLTTESNFVSDHRQVNVGDSFEINYPVVPQAEITNGVLYLMGRTFRQ